MTLQRIAIRNEIVRLLRDAGTIAGQNVFNDQPSKMWEEDAPAVYVWTRREQVQVASDTPREYQRDLEVIIEAHTKRTIGARAADLVDVLLSQAEFVMEKNRLWPTLADLFCVQPSTSGLEDVDLDLSSETSRVQGGGALSYSLQYFTGYVPSEAELSAFRRAQVNWDLGPNPDGIIEAQDALVFQLQKAS